MKKHKSLKELGLTLQQYAAFLATLELLRRPHLFPSVSRSCREASRGVSVTEALHATMLKSPVFSMSDIRRVKTCGTIVCFGGMMTWIMGMDHDAADRFVATANASAELHRLFFPPDRYEWSLLRRKEVIRAAESFLETGVTSWEHLPSVEAVEKRKPEAFTL